MQIQNLVKSCEFLGYAYGPKSVVIEVTNQKFDIGLCNVLAAVKANIKLMKKNQLYFGNV